MANPEAAFNPGPAATTLAEAWRSGERLTALPEAVRPKTLAEGYDVQDALVGEIGTRAEGWKLGVGSRSGMRAAKIDRPLVGRVMAPRVYRMGDTVVGSPGTELEFAL